MDKNSKHKLTVNEQKREDAKKQIMADRGCIFRIFQSDDGRKALEILQDNFSKRTSVVPGDPYMTHAREGAREVVLFIEEILEDAY